MVTIELYGDLAAQFGPKFKADVRTPAEAFRCMEANFPGKFLSTVRDGHFKIVRGGMEIGENDLNKNMVGAKNLKIIPVPAMAKNGGIGKILMGVAILAIVAVAAVATGGAGLAGLPAFLGTEAIGVLGVSITWGNIAMVGVAMLIGGIISAITPMPKVSDQEYGSRNNDNPSFLFQGAVNISEPGGPVPVVYGIMLTGSVTISGGISVVDISDRSEPNTIYALDWTTERALAGSFFTPGSLSFYNNQYWERTNQYTGPDDPRKGYPPDTLTNPIFWRAYSNTDNVQLKRQFEIDNL